MWLRLSRGDPDRDNQLVRLQHRLPVTGKKPPHSDPAPAADARELDLGVEREQREGAVADRRCGGEVPRQRCPRANERRSEKGNHLGEQRNTMAETFFDVAQGKAGAEYQHARFFENRAKLGNPFEG